MKKKEIDRVLAIVNTTYQLLVVLYLRQAFYKNRPMDLVISGKTEGLQELCKNPMLSSLFSHIYFADVKKIKNIHKKSVQVFLESFVFNGTTKKILGEPLRKYGECLYASPIGVDEITKELSKTIILNNPGVRFIKYEDGVGSYTVLSGFVVSTELGRLWYKKILGFDNQAQENEIYLFEPNIAKETSEYKTIQIPLNNREVMEQAESIFDVKDILVRQKCIFFGQGTREFVQDIAAYTSMLSYIAEIVGEDEIIVKKHPRGVYDEFGERFPFMEAEYPWELLAGREEMQDKILISFSSTACITGRLMFASCNPVIFLHGLAGTCIHGDSRLETYFKRLQQQYNNIYIPETKEELKHILHGLLKSE